MLRLFAILWFGVGLCVAQQRAELWEGKVPLAMGESEADRPFMEVYLPKANPTRTGVLVFPGGGYGYLAVAGEGTQVAEWLVQRGVAAFVLHYRVKPYRYPAPMLDAQRGMRLVRSHAAAYGIDPEKLGVMGFSAGGHLASYLMTHPGVKSSPDVSDSVEKLSTQPAFGILAYAVISMRKDITHAGSHENLIGKNIDPLLDAELSNDERVTAFCPPVFLFATTDDPRVPVANSVRFYSAYVNKNLSAEMHLFDHGPHGSGLAEKLPGASAWPVLMQNWMQRHGWMISDAPNPAR